MNTSNLQLEGVLMALAAINQLLVKKGIATSAEIDGALALAEQAAGSRNQAGNDLSDANQDAIVFPLRLLRQANAVAPDATLPSFAELARTVGQTKPSHCE